MSDWLNLIIRQAQEVRDDPTSFYEWCDVATEAVFRRKELPAWRQCARGRTIKPVAFLDMFKTFVFSQQFAGHPQAEATRIEFVPQMLGMRAREAGKDFGYWSRHALLREDKRDSPEKVISGENPNWDCGVFLEPENLDFENPTRKLQIKTKKQKSSPQRNDRPAFYRRAGIQSVSAQRYGFADTEFIKNACRSELMQGGPVTAASIQASGRLDAITRELFASFHEPLSPDEGGAVEN